MFSYMPRNRKVRTESNVDLKYTNGIRNQESSVMWWLSVTELRS